MSIKYFLVIDIQPFTLYGLKNIEIIVYASADQTTGGQGLFPWPFLFFTTEDEERTDGPEQLSIAKRKRTKILRWRRNCRSGAPDHCCGYSLPVSSGAPETPSSVAGCGNREAWRWGSCRQLRLSHAFFHCDRPPRRLFHLRYDPCFAAGRADKRCCLLGPYSRRSNIESGTKNHGQRRSGKGGNA